MSDNQDLSAIWWYQLLWLKLLFNISNYLRKDEFLCDFGLYHKQPFSSVASSKANQNPIHDIGLVARNVLSLWGVTVKKPWVYRILYKWLFVKQINNIFIL